MRSIPTGALVVMSLVFMVGCAAGRVAYEKPGSTEADRKRDVSDCTQTSISHDPGRHVLTPVVLDREAFARCLESRGYSRAR